jgi:uncharacterized UPF0146 family protein
MLVLLLWCLTGWRLYMMSQSSVNQVLGLILEDCDIIYSLHPVKHHTSNTNIWLTEDCYIIYSLHPVKHHRSNTNIWFTEDCDIIYSPQPVKHMLVLLLWCLTGWRLYMMSQSSVNQEDCYIIYSLHPVKHHRSNPNIWLTEDCDIIYSLHPVKHHRSNTNIWLKDYIWCHNLLLIKC